MKLANLRQLRNAFPPANLANNRAIESGMENTAPIGVVFFRSQMPAASSTLLASPARIVAALLTIEHALALVPAWC